MNIKRLGIQDYHDVWLKMKEFTQSRLPETQDELWLLEHNPVYTQGQAGKAEHLLNPQAIPVVHSDRGGQVTYHGPGQLVAYVLIDLTRRAIGVRTLVTKLEQILISVLKSHQIVAHIRCGAPGVYVNEEKIASIGLRVKNGRTYHGIALNVNMDLQPFLGINPCGFSDLKITQVSNFVPDATVLQLEQCFEHHFRIHFAE
jgi:lipoyl(octanoyl) transferase